MRNSNITHLQNALQQISSWMTANLLTLNSSKTECQVQVHKFARFWRLTLEPSYVTEPMHMYKPWAGQ